MNLIKIFQKYPDQESCIEHLENVRWGDMATCPHCGSVKVARKCDAHRVGRWNCHDCKSSFNVLSGTIFEKTKIPLQKWFLAIALMLNAKKSLSSHELSRDLDLNQKTAWYMMTRIRQQMLDDSIEMLQGIVEADECYIGGKPRKKAKRDDDDFNNPRGRGTKKMSVLGAVERHGKVIARVSNDTKGATIAKFIENNVDLVGTLLMTDEYRGYKTIRESLSAHYGQIYRMF